MQAVNSSMVSPSVKASQLMEVGQVLFSKSGSIKGVDIGPFLFLMPMD